MKKTKKKNQTFLTVIEMLFSLFQIPCGLAMIDDLVTETEHANAAVMPPTGRINTVLMPAAFLCLAVATFLQAVTKRYRHDHLASCRQIIDYIRSAAYLGCAVLLFIKPVSAKAWGIMCAVYLLSLVPGRVLSIIRDHRWYRVVVNVVLILLLLLYGLGMTVLDPATTFQFGLVVIMMLAVAGFMRIMTVIFASIRLDLLRDVVRKTYATEIIFGLVLLILSFSWVLVYMDPAFGDYGNALWYCFAVVTTVGFGDITATTLVGRILSVILGIYGIIVVALITSVIVNFYGEMKKAGPAKETDEEDAPEGGEQKETGTAEALPPAGNPEG